MRNGRINRGVLILAVWLAAAFATACNRKPEAPSPDLNSRARVEEALHNIFAVDRPGRVGYATAWDGNRFIQCHYQGDLTLRCEAAGVRMQPSLAHILTTARLARLTDLGWRPEPHFGGYAITFPAITPREEAADRILRTLVEGYDAHLDQLEVETDWIADQPCPPRNGPGQNLAGMVNDAPAMASAAVTACDYTPRPMQTPAPQPGQTLAASAAASAPAATLDENVEREAPRVFAEIQRLRINQRRDVFAIFDTGAGYVQCQPDADPPTIYCEAQSADNWPALARVLTPERIARLHAAGYQDPGRSSNYSRSYPADRSEDDHIADQILRVLHDVYGYSGAARLKVTTESDPGR